MEQYKISKLYCDTHISSVFNKQLVSELSKYSSSKQESETKFSKAQKENITNESFSSNRKDSSFKLSSAKDDNSSRHLCKREKLQADQNNQGKIISKIVQTKKQDAGADYLKKKKPNFRLNTKIKNLMKNNFVKNNEIEKLNQTKAERFDLKIERKFVMKKNLLTQMYERKNSNIHAQNIDVDSPKKFVIKKVRAMQELD